MYKPWISYEIRNKISELSKIFKTFSKCKNEIRKADLLYKFKVIKNEITHLTRIGKKAYYQKYFSENKNNLQKIWKGIKEIINIKSKSYDYPTCLQVNDTTITNPIDISNSFNDYFTSIADEILKKRKYNGTKSYRDFLSSRLLENFVFEESTDDEIKSIISSLKINLLVQTIYLHIFFIY